MYKHYELEILRFLQTLSIKFDLFAEVYKTRLMQERNILIDDDKDNPYYQNLCGKYSVLDTPMYTVSVEDGSEVLFCPELRTTHPKTFANFQVGSAEYETLIQRYPEQTNLIKNIVYPVQDIDTAINAPNFTVLKADYNILRTNERESIRHIVDSTLEYIHMRWYIADYSQENLYPTTFYGMLFGYLYQAILTQRVKNIRTSNVHPYHIWEYLFSKGIGDYRDILTETQALFLYRNMGYILQNRGKRSNLEILADNLLKGLQVKLVAKTILEQTDDGSEDCVLIPEVLSDSVVNAGTFESIDESKYETMDHVLNRVKSEGYFPDLTPRISDDITEKFGNTSLNIIPTRLMELEKTVLHTEYQHLLMEFLLQNVVFRKSKHLLNYRVKYTDENINMEIDLSLDDALLLFHYAHYREFGEVIETIPTKYPVSLVYKSQRPKDYELPKWISFMGTDYLMTTVVDVQTTLDEILWTDRTSFTKEEFVDHVAAQFEILVVQQERLRQCGNLIYHDAMNKFFDYLTVREMVDLNLTDKPNYSSWIASKPDIETIIRAYENLGNDQEMFKELCHKVLTNAVPVTHPIFFKYTAHDPSRLRIYDGLKNLFIRLCSYRLTFLETQRDTLSFLISDPLTIGRVADDISSDNRLDIPKLSISASNDQFSDLAHLSDLDGIYIADGYVMSSDLTDITVRLTPNLVNDSADTLDSLNVGITPQKLESHIETLLSIHVGSNLQNISEEM
jgi:hypothetical protein